MIICCKSITQNKIKLQLDGRNQNFYSLLYTLTLIFVCLNHPFISCFRLVHLCLSILSRPRSLPLTGLLILSSLGLCPQDFVSFQPMPWEYVPHELNLRPFGPSIRTYE
jgi:hypothetical protein